MIRGILLFDFEFFIAFVFIYLFVKLLIFCLSKWLTFAKKYFLLKAIPFLCLLTMGIDFYLRKTGAVLFRLNPPKKWSMGDNLEIIVQNRNFEFFIDGFLKYFIIVWIIGIFVFGVKYCVDYLKFKCMFYGNGKINTSSFLNEKLNACKRQLNAEICVDIYYGEYAETPFTFGIFKPHIIIPSSLSENLETIILHELIHCIHYDTRMNAGKELLKVILWFHPFVYMYALDLADFCEYACDERVTNQMTFAEKKVYAQTILANVRKRSLPTWGVTLSTAKGLKRRLSYFLYPICNDAKKRNFLLFFCSLFVISIGTWLLHSLNVNKYFPTVSINEMLREDSQIKIIRVNYLPGQEAKDYYYEEYIDGFWWRGTLLAEKSREITDELTEITFSGEIYKCDE